MVQLAHLQPCILRVAELPGPPGADWRGGAWGRERGSAAPLPWLGSPARVPVGHVRAGAAPQEAPPHSERAMCRPCKRTRRWEASQRHVFPRVDPAGAALTVRLWDDRGGRTLLRKGRQLVGEGTLHAGHITVRAWPSPPSITHH